MLSFAAPAWLLGCLLAPVIRWLHRGGRPRAAVPVARAALWRAAPVALADEGARQPPDPAWRRRAALALVLALALSGPQWPQAPAKLTLWVDDSPSMLTREVGGTRLALGLAAWRGALATQRWDDVELRALSAPWQALGLGAAVAVSGAEAAPPPAALLRPDRVHWLLTDGAHPAIQAWPAGRVPARVLQVGQGTRNVGIERLAARRHEGDPARLDLLVTLRNGGNATETRELTITLRGQPPQRQTLTIAPDEAASLVVGGPRAAGVAVSLSPADALPEDDSASLSLESFAPLPVQLGAACPASLRAAVAAHPSLQPVPAGAAAKLQLACDEDLVSGPALRWRAERLPTPAAGALQWAAGVAPPQRPPLDAARLRVVAALPLQEGDAVLLAAGGQPLLVRRTGSPARLDVALEADALGPDLPLLLDFAAEQLLGRPLLDPVAALDRGPTAALVLPTAAPAATAQAATPAAEPRSWARPLLALALALLAWEVAALGQRWRGLRRHEREVAG